MRSDSAFEAVVAANASCGASKLLTRSYQVGGLKPRFPAKTACLPARPLSFCNTVSETPLTGVFGVEWEGLLGMLRVRRRVTVGRVSRFEEWLKLHKQAEIENRGLAGKGNNFSTDTPTEGCVTQEKPRPKMLNWRSG